ncbi:MAG TPA: hypothetical protein DGC76_02855 [Candidatus Accumulibacter sp.]|nr:hypothetical protein [Accumulibacter sp.]
MASSTPTHQGSIATNSSRSSAVLVCLRLTIFVSSLDQLRCLAAVCWRAAYPTIDRVSHSSAKTPTSKRGQELIQHEMLGIRIHLFVRETKLQGGKGAPFVYIGKVRYRSHEGTRPMSVIFSL